MCQEKEMIVDNKKLIIKGKLVKICEIKDEFTEEEIQDPDLFIKELKNTKKTKADIFTFTQKFPDIKPRYKYYMEWDNLAVVPIKSFDYWWEKQIQKQVRTKVRKSEKKGVVVNVVAFNDDYVKGVVEIVNESKIRQGKIFPVYAKGFKQIRKNLLDKSNMSFFLGAYLGKELIGFAKIITKGKYARTGGILSTIKHCDKAPMNALIAKTVEVCAEKDISYLIYGKFAYGKKGQDTLSDFKRHNGFEEVDFPRYYIPLTIKGKIALKLHLHHGFIEILPAKLIKLLLFLRTKWYLAKYNKR